MHILFTILFTLLISFSTPTMARESTFDRVKRTGTIRCAYMNYPPFVNKNINTGKFEGLMVEIMDEVGKALDYKIAWTEEAGYGDYPEGLKSGRYDMFCNVTGPTPMRAKEAWFTDPMWHEAVYVYTQSQNKGRFKTKADLNKPSLTSILVDGEFFWMINDKHFPKAKKYSLPNMTPSSMVFTDLGTKKADFAIHGYQAFSLYNRKNPGKIIRAIKDPVHIATICMGLPLGDVGFRYMINATLQLLHKTGVINELLTKYNMPPDVSYRMKKNYIVPE